jgi:hypothetical protein
LRKIVHINWICSSLLENAVYNNNLKAMKKSFPFYLSITLSLLLTVLALQIAVASPANSKISGISYKVPVYCAEATQYQPGQDLGKAIDGDKSTMYHSNWSGGTLPDTLDFRFVDVSRIDSMIYYPRISGGHNGDFGNIEIWYSPTAEPSTFIKLLDKDFGMSSTPAKLALNGANAVLNPATIRIIVKSGTGNFASCAEMEFKTTVKPEEPVVCDPSSAVKSDIKQAVASGTASNFQSGENIENSFDGDMSTMYHSNWNGGGFPITLNYNFSNVDKIDYLIYHPRTSGENGLFKETEIWYSTTTSPATFIKLFDYNFNGSASSTKVNFLTSLVNPSTIRIIVKSGQGNFASCAEMEFYKTTAFDNTSYPAIFKDAIFSWLKPGVTQADINGMADGFYKSLAQCMFNGTYDTKFRVQQYEPYPTISTTANALKTSTYSAFENPTGIYFEAGTTAIIFVEDAHGQPVSLKVSDYSSNSNSTYPLATGLNRITLSSKGLGYINYYTDSYATLLPVKIHIASGKINGYYDVARTTSTEWKSMLMHAVTNMIDLKGKYIGMLYPVASLKQYSPNDGKELVQVYDSIVRIEQEQMGLYKYNRVPKNHMYAEATGEDGGWYAGGKGAHFGGGLDVTCNATKAKENCWGIAHELGHVNQIRPGLKWVSTTEVTNNVHSVWITYLFSTSPYNRKLEVETINDGYYNGFETGTGFGKGNNIVGGRFNAFLNNGVLKGQRWLCQYGPDAMRSSGTEPDWNNGNGDHFVKLCVLWQLELYYQVIHPEKKDWYGDIAEKVRNANESGLPDGKLMLNFMKNTCDAVHEDLTDYFRKVGMLRTYDNFMNDYSSAQLTITAADSIAVVNYVKAKGYPKPETPVLYYLSANSIIAFKNKLSVVGTTGLGCTPVLTSANDYQKYITVDHSVWKNVAAFETYKGNDVIRISMAGSGYENNDKTRVYYPTNATAIYAVGWDGSKKLVYSSGTTSVFLPGINSSAYLFPNPVTDIFKICGITDTAKLTLTDMYGRLSLTKEVTDNEPISVSSLAEGVYMARIVTSKGIIEKKLIKK